MDQLRDHLVPFVLVAFRLSGVFMLAPILASLVVPMQVRVLLVGLLAVIVYPTVPAAALGPVPGDAIGLALAVVGEVLIGFSIGLLAMLPVAAVQLAGFVMGLQMGFGFAQIINPTLETESDLLGELLIYMAMSLYLLLGGLEATFLAVCNTFAHIPLAGFSPAAAPLDLVTGTLAGGFELAIRLSLPLLAIVMLETVASAFLMKTMPQINIMSIGFATKIVLGVAAIIVAARAINTSIGDHVIEVGRAILRFSIGS